MGVGARTHWRDYVRAAAVTAACALPIRIVLAAYAPSLLLHWLAVPLATGFLAVRLFTQRHGQSLERWRATGLGALAGAFVSLGSAALQVAILATQRDEVMETVLQQVREAAETLPAQPDLAPLLENPGVFAIVVGVSLILEAALLAALAAGGGALAAGPGRHARE